MWSESIQLRAVTIFIGMSTSVCYSTHFHYRCAVWISDHCCRLLGLLPDDGIFHGRSQISTEDLGGTTGEDKTEGGTYEDVSRLIA